MKNPHDRLFHLARRRAEQQAAEARRRAQQAAADARKRAENIAKSAKKCKMKWKKGKLKLVCK